MTKVAGTQNPADILTKYKGLRDCEEQPRGSTWQMIAQGRLRGGVWFRERRIGAWCVCGWESARRALFHGLNVPQHEQNKNATGLTSEGATASSEAYCR